MQKSISDKMQMSPNRVVNYSNYSGFYTGAGKGAEEDYEVQCL